ncbi:TonB-linked SusC/RagA family outer membrane protein [Mucilaginibacter gracilis]|uniref:TonB-dependent receptor plug n=2 Tax=Mucilaginibacter TaxID=423349 RepID=H1YHP7_9SPHI|nr:MULTISPECIES: TonB-dependent receptor [Mucilaginibacter]EHQ27447.1 TonB-dependent receptor plug [Mucilaginibacter paludis DSM 18603]RKR81014.1 TonB-linked SusC/RagA family outer membrane protein [Mucilaginibacter gracilis]
MRSIKNLLTCILLSQMLLFVLPKQSVAQTSANAKQLIRIAGIVLDEKGAPLPGVSVKLKGTSNGVATDVGGNFSINVPGMGAILVYSFIGYEPLEQSIGGKTTLKITLTPSVKSLEQVIIVGYGTVRKRDLTGSVVSVKGDEITKVAASNPMEALQGKVAGVDITRTSGAAGAGVGVTVRGNRSLNASNSPLYIVDGIIYSNYEDINQNDIASMEFLKDASSTAIYGSRGANGVIIITTKRGGEGKPKVSAGSYYGVSEITGYPVPMTGPQYANLKREGYRTIGTWNSTADDPKVFTSSGDLAAVQNGDSYYWPGYFLHKGSQQDYNASVSGGNDKTKAYFSFDYFKEKGLYTNDYSSRYSLRLNVDHELFKDFKVGLQSQLAYYDQNLRSDNVLSVANKIIPYFNPYSADGSLAKFPGNGNQVNPLYDEEAGQYVNKNNITHLLSTAYAEWKPADGLTIRSNLGVTLSSSRNGHFEGTNTLNRALSSGSLSSETNSTDNNLIWENIITYQRKINHHNFTLTGVTSYQSSVSDQASASGTGQLLSDQSFYALQNNPANLKISSNYVGQNLESGALRLNYSFKERYLLTLTGRADGSSVLAKGNKWAFFPSAAAAWRIIDEPFMKSQSVVSELKARLSYGVAGNAAVKPYQTQSGLILVPYSYNDITALAYELDPNIGNQKLKWELTGTLNAGIDFGVFRDRISGSIDYYDSQTRDLLLSQKLPSSTGALTTLANVGRSRNTGIELTVRTNNIKTNKFSWSSNITYTRNKERITYLPNGVNDLGNNWFIGYPVVSYFDYQKLGIWQTSEAAQAAVYGYKPGDIKVADIDGSGTITAAGDRVVLGSAVPKYSFGFSNDFKYKSFDLNVLVYGRIGQMFVSQYALKYEPNAIENGANVDYWTPENPTNDYPRPNANISKSATPFASTLGYKDGSFVKIRSASLGYNFSPGITKALHVSNLRLYISAKNFLTFSKIKDYDPEGGGSFDRPLTKLFLAGLNVSL